MKNTLIFVLIVIIVVGIITVVVVWPENSNQNINASNQNTNQSKKNTIDGNLDADTVITLNQEVNYDNGKIIISLVDLKYDPASIKRGIVPRINISGSAVTDQIFDFSDLMGRVYISTDIEGYRIILKSEDIDSATVYVQKPFSTEDDYVCADGIIDCMPIVPPENSQYCTRDYLSWAQVNCPDVQISH